MVGQGEMGGGGEMGGWGVMGGWGEMVSWGEIGLNFVNLQYHEIRIQRS